MPNNNYFAQLSPEQKAELFSIYVNAGYKTLSSISADFNKRANGGFSTVLDKFKQLPSREDLQDAISRKIKLIQEKDFNGFAGGEFGGAGASDRFEYDPQGVLTERWIRNTPIPIERSFSEAYSDARKSGLSTFEFNGKTYNTNYDPNAKLGPREYDTIMANLREVLDENRKPISDSTRIEPWVGQIPGEHKMAYGGRHVFYDEMATKPIFSNGGLLQNPPEIRATIVTPDKDYSYFLNSLPDNQRFTPESEYSTRRYWELNGKPKDFEAAKALGMYTLDPSDGMYHANTIAWGNDGIGYFMKPRHHDTIGYELDWYNKGLVTEPGGSQRQMSEIEKEEWEEFKKAYDLDTTGTFFRYVPKEFASGGGIYIKNSKRDAFAADANDLEQWTNEYNKRAYGGSNGNGFLNRMLGKVKQAFGIVSLPENTQASGYNWTEDDVKNLARAFENKESKAYIGVKGDILGGYGHKLTDDEIAKYWDKKKSKSIGAIDDSVIDTWLNDDMGKAFKSVERYYGKDLPSNIWAALSSLAFQGGDLLIRGKRDSSNKIRKDWSGGSPLFEEAVKKYLDDKTDVNMQGIIDQMQYKDDGNSKLSGLSSRYGLYRAMIDNTADPSKVYEYKNDGTYKLYKSNKKKN